jgi:hypothetical protein
MRPQGCEKIEAADLRPQGAASGGQDLEFRHMDKFRPGGCFEMINDVAGNLD